MNVVLATDDNFVQHCCVAMISVLKHNSDVKFYIFTEGLTDESMSLMTSLVKSNGGEINFCTVNSEIVQKFPMPSYADKHISIATYYRLLAEFLLPATIDKFIYMDCDMVVRNSLKSLWGENVDDYAIGAVFQPISIPQENDKLRLQIPEKYGYFNAGLLLVNLEYWRNRDVTNRLLNFIKEKSSCIKQHDQDVLNAVLYNEVKPISYIWNFLPLFLHIQDLKFKDYVNYSSESQDPIVIHYVSAPKPWDFGCSHPYKDEYYTYLRDTPFREFKPKFIWGKYYENVLRHQIVKICISMDFLNLRKLVKR